MILNQRRCDVMTLHRTDATLILRSITQTSSAYIQNMSDMIDSKYAVYYFVVTVEKQECDLSCPGRCYQPGILGCCHPECAVSCHGNLDTECDVSIQL